MKFSSLLVIAFAITTALAAQSEERFIARYTPVAIQGMHRHQVPASLQLALAMMHSESGTSELSHTHHNLFRLSCDDFEEPVAPTADCHRTYTDGAASFEDHLKYLATARFSLLRGLPLTDYHRWVEALLTTGYFSSRADAAVVISHIESYSLYLLDFEESEVVAGRPEMAAAVVAPEIPVVPQAARPTDRGELTPPPAERLPSDYRRNDGLNRMAARSGEAMPAAANTAAVDATKAHQNLKAKSAQRSADQQQKNKKKLGQRRGF